MAAETRHVILPGMLFRYYLDLPMPFEQAERALIAPGLLPALDGDLEVASLGPNRVQCSISAMCTPPMGTFGRALDRALLHRVAKATVKEFLERVAAGMKERHSAVPARRIELNANGRE